MEKAKKSKKNLLLLILVVVAAIGIRVYDYINGGVRLTEGEAELHFIYVGQGDSTLIMCEEGNILIDAGPFEARNDVVTYLEGVGVKEIEYCIFTHPHEDHIGGAKAVIENFDVKNVIMTDRTADTKTYLNLLGALEKSDARVLKARIGDTYSVGDFEFEILAPFDTGSKVDTNNTSIVIRAVFGTSSMLFMGDAESGVEAELIEAYGDGLRSDLIKVGHHGSKTSSSQKFLDEVDPEYAVISCGVDNIFAHPHRETLDRLNKMDVKIFRTDKSGTVVLLLDGKSIYLK